MFTKGIINLELKMNPRTMTEVLGFKRARVTLSYGSRKAHAVQENRKACLRLDETKEEKAASANH